MRVWKRLTAVGCAAMVLFSSNCIVEQPLFEFPAVITASAATTYDMSTATADVTISDSGEYIITGSTTEYKVIIQGGSPTITIQDLTIDFSSYNTSEYLSSNYCPIEISSGSCTFNLKGTNTFTGGYNNPGIRVKSGTALAIEGDDGELNATGGHSSAGIGGGIQEDSGNITINSGTITATGTYDGAAGIGGGGTNGSGWEAGGTRGNININGGTVTAYGASSGAGIGSGLRARSAGGTIEITGGTVYAQGGYGGAGIGGGNYVQGGDIFISGGMVTAKAGKSAKDIGAGKNTSGENLQITGGIINGTNYGDPIYTVTIPASVELGSEATIQASDVYLNADQTLYVKLTATSGTNNALTLKDSYNNEMTYTISNGSTQYKVEDTVLSTNTDKEVTLKFEPDSVPYAGTYTGTVTFTISVE